MVDKNIQHSVLPELAPPRQPTKLQLERQRQIVQMMGRVRRNAPHLNSNPDLFRPQLRSYCQLSILIQRAYAELCDAPIISSVTGEIRSSVNMFRMMTESQKSLARDLRISPTTFTDAQNARVVKPILDLEGMRDEFESAK